MLIADLYIRVSTDEQADKGYSQRDQHVRLERYCNQNQITIAQVIFEDHSAKNFNRPEWTKYINHIKKRSLKSNLVLFTKWDRFSRNAGDAYQMIKLLLGNNISPQAIEQPLDMSIPENKMMLAIYLAAPEVENDRRALNTFYGMRRAQKEGMLGEVGWSFFAVPSWKSNSMVDKFCTYSSIFIFQGVMPGMVGFADHLKVLSNSDLYKILIPVNFQCPLRINVLSCNIHRGIICNFKDGSWRLHDLSGFPANFKMPHIRFFGIENKRGTSEPIFLSIVTNSYERAQPIQKFRLLGIFRNTVCFVIQCNSGV
ncbi:recombinase family protein [uncultured Chryseobacterium sp.]|uniref:recombinase family protein n=1 Tax=uncultured Chryseobacterium sp. TaxID=259322 RepID=UPI00258B1232|nr:recombinase family protein [uncultured Chryseobacterium sp.]